MLIQVELLVSAMRSRVPLFTAVEEDWDYYQIVAVDANG